MNRRKYLKQSGFAAAAVTTAGLGTVAGASEHASVESSDPEVLTTFEATGTAGTFGYSPLESDGCPHPDESYELDIVDGGEDYDIEGEIAIEGAVHPDGTWTPIGIESECTWVPTAASLPEVLFEDGEAWGRWDFRITEMARRGRFVPSAGVITMPMVIELLFHPPSFTSCSTPATSLQPSQRERAVTSRGRWANGMVTRSRRRSSPTSSR